MRLAKPMQDHLKAQHGSLPVCSNTHIVRSLSSLLPLLFISWLLSLYMYLDTCNTVTSIIPLHVTGPRFSRNVKTSTILPGRVGTAGSTQKAAGTAAGSSQNSQMLLGPSIFPFLA